MRYFELPNVLLLAGYLSSVVAATQRNHRVLRAATTRSKLLRRDTRITQKYETEVVYIENENGWNGGETFASTVKVGSKKPILNLEEIEHHLQYVQCGDGKMMLHFVDASSAQDARAACFGGHGGMGGLVVTSHESCNKEGERAVYKIDDVLYAKEGVALDLAVTEALWQDAFENLDINFGHTRYDHIYRRHSDFSRARRKRQNDETIKIPTNTPENVNDAKFDIVSQLLNTTFKAVDFTKINSLIPVPGVRVPELPLEVGCKNCSTRGQVILTQGAIKINMKQFDVPDIPNIPKVTEFPKIPDLPKISDVPKISDIPKIPDVPKIPDIPKISDIPKIPDIFGKRDDSKGIGSIIEGGYMELAVTGVGARLEMFAHPIKSGSYEISLFSLPVLGFVIPGIGQAGASFEPRISVDFELDGEVAINYGIDVAIPDHAGIKVELSDLTNTKITGMKGSTLHALPFTTNATDIDLSLSLAFTPTIPIGFDFSDQLTALVTVSLDLPRLDARLSTKADKQCSLLDKGNTTKIDKKPKYKRTDLSELVLVESNISVAIDVSADLKLPLLPAPLGSAGTSAQIFSTEMPLMTSCIAPTKGKLKITEMAPVATLIADVVNAKAEEQAACPKHPDGGCTCATATTVYAVPPTSEPPFTNTGYGEPPRATNPLTGMTFYYPDAPTAPASTPSGGYWYGPSAQSPANSTSCASTQTLRITISTASASMPEVPSSPPIIVIPAPKPCNSTTTPSTASPSTSSEALPPSSLTPPAPTPEPNTTTSLATHTTTPPKIEESKGFMAPPGSLTITARVNSTGVVQFTGAAAPGIVGPVMRWAEVGWQVGLVGIGIGVGALVV